MTALWIVAVAVAAVCVAASVVVACSVVVAARADRLFEELREKGHDG